MNKSMTVEQTQDFNYETHTVKKVYRVIKLVNMLDEPIDAILSPTRLKDLIESGVNVTIIPERT